MTVRTIAISTVLLGATAFAQSQSGAPNPPQIQQANNIEHATVIHPGSVLAYTVKFDGDPNISQVQLLLNLTSQPSPEQNRLQPNFWANTFRKTGPGTYEISGVVPQCPTGTYQVLRLDAIVPQYGDFTFNYPADFHESDLTVRIENTGKNVVPILKSIEPDHDRK